jgi:hypothetical protein
MQYKLEVRGIVMHFRRLYNLRHFFQFSGDIGIESCGVSWKSEDEFLNLSISTIYIIYEILKAAF